LAITRLCHARTNYAGQAGKVVPFSIKDPNNPIVTSIVDLRPNSGPHYLHLSKDEKQLVVSDYFLNEDLEPPGVVHVDGDHKIHVIKVDEGKLELDTKFNLDFNTAFSTGKARPHGLTLLNSRGDNANSDGS
jgi:selenium-binding protein 1